MADVKTEMLELSDYAYQRTLNRMQGLTDEEYLWEPVPDCWSIRPDPDGGFTGTED